MAPGWWKKVKDFFKRVGTGIKKKVIEPVARFFKPVVKTAVDVIGKAGTAIGGAVGAAKGNPQMGLKIGSAAQGIAQQIGPMIK